MEHNAKNYRTQGGDRLVIGGSLEIKEGASVTGLPPATVAAATEESLGGVLAATKSQAPVDQAGACNDGSCGNAVAVLDADAIGSGCGSRSDDRNRPDHAVQWHELPLENNLGVAVRRIDDI